MDANRRTRYGWMALGGLVCLFAVVLACKVGNGNKAHAEGPKLPEATPMKDEKAALPAPPQELPPLGKVPSLDVPAPGDATLPPPLADGTPLPPIKPDMPKAAEIKPTSADFAAPAPPGATAPTAAAPSVAALESLPPLGAAPPAVSAPVVAPATGSETRPIMIPAAGAAKPPASDVPPSAPGVLPPVGGGPMTAPTPVPPPGKPEITPVSVTPAPAVTPPGKPSVVVYHVRTAGMTFRTLARKTLGSAERWTDIQNLNPYLGPESVLSVGTTVSLPADAQIGDDDVLRPLPTLRPRPVARPKAVLPLTGTFPVATVVTADGRAVPLPKAVRDQLANCDTVMVSPGSSRCLWITNQAHLDRLGAKLEKSSAREADVQAFKRLYFAQITKLPVREGQFVLNDKLTQFAGLGGEVVLVGIDDHFEVWDASVWRKFTATRKGGSGE